MTHICVSKLTIIGSDNGLSPGRRQAIIWNNTGILSIGLLGTNFSEILIEILTFSFKKIRLKVSSAKRRPFCLGLNVLNSVEDGLAPNTRKRFVVIGNYVFLNLCFTIGEKPSSYHWGPSLHRIYRYILSIYINIKAPLGYGNLSSYI